MTALFSSVSGFAREYCGIISPYVFLRTGILQVFIFPCLNPVWISSLIRRASTCGEFLLFLRFNGRNAVRFFGCVRTEAGEE